MRSHMRSHVTVMDKINIDHLVPELMESDRLKLLSHEFYQNLNWLEFRTFCHEYARYGIPTIKLIEFLKFVIDDRPAIEIGAGAGDLGYHLGIKMTDSKQQEDPDVKRAYKNMHQPVIKYPSDVERLEALDAVYKYKPKVVVGSWITTYSKREAPYNSNPWGIKEPKILDLVETFIIVGNLDVHGDKPIRKVEHRVIQEPWIVSRAKNQNNNCIFIWDKKKEI
jgi:hypothetical protein